MSALVWLAVGILGGGASVARFLLDGAVAARFGREFPLGMLVVNLSGCVAAGLLYGLAGAGDLRLLAGTATLGSFTTFSTWMLDLERSAEQDEAGALVANLVLSAVLGLGGVALGRAIGSVL